MKLNPDINKQAVQVIFSRKGKNPFILHCFFNEAPGAMKDEQKHLGTIFDSALNFLDYGDIIYHGMDPELSVDFTKKT